MEGLVLSVGYETIHEVELYVCNGEEMFSRRVVAGYLRVDGVVLSWCGGRFTVIHAVGPLRVV